MKKYVIIGIVVILVLSVYGSIKGTYNRLVAGDERVQAAWAQVDNQLQRRYDLIPNLVQTVKGYAAHEEGVFIQVTEARAKVGGASTISDKMAANGELGAALSRLLLVVENYPDLKANQNFIRLQDELSGTENRIAVERRRFNETVRGYNTLIRSFPTNVMSGFFGFERAGLFETLAEAQAAPQVQF